MRIISKFHDYYDSVQSVGYDPNLIYHRVQNEYRIELRQHYYYGRNPDNFIMPEGMPTFSESFLMHVSPMVQRGGASFMPDRGTLFLIGFCGKYYLALEQTVTVPPYNFSESEYLHDKDSAVKFFQERRKNQPEREVFGILGECTVNPFADSLEPFRALNAPVFRMDLRNYRSIFSLEKTLTVNPELAAMQFYRVFDPFTAYQEIAMFLSGVLGWPENAMVQISDEDMRDAKGFDEWSFKKKPTKRKSKCQ